MNSSLFASTRKHHRLFILICIFSSWMTFSYLSSFLFDPLLTDTTHRALGDNTDVYCELRPAVEPPPEVIPIIAASYPGSGSKMTWNLIEGLTSFWTGDDWFTNGREKNVVSIKTHYPHPQGRLIPFQDELSRVLLLIRHPMDAIPSYYSYLYEMENGLPPHSTRAPKEAWIPWRDEKFKKELELWKETIIFWMDSYPKNQRIVLFYEKLVEEEIGPFEAARLSSFLEKAQSVTGYDSDEIPCVWRAIVKYHEQVQELEAMRKLKGKRNLDEQNLDVNQNSTNLTAIVSEDEEDWIDEVYRPNPASFRTGPRDYPFTMKQHVMVWQALKDLQRMYYGSELYWMFDSYVNRILHNRI